MVFALLGAEGSFGVKDAADRLLPPTCSRAVAEAGSAAVRSASAARAARSRSPLLVVPAGRARPARRRPGARELPRRAGSPSRSGAVLVAASLVALAPLAFLNDRADLDLLDPDLRRWIGLPARGRLPRLPRRRARPRGGGRYAARLARPRAGAARGRLSTGAIKAIGALALAAYALRAAASSRWRYLADLALLLLATNLFNLLDLRPGRAEKALVLLGAGLCLGAWTVAPLELLGIFVGPVLVGAWLHAARAGDARRHRLEPGRRGRRASGC